MPFGRHGTAFVEELADIINGFAKGTSVKQFAWKAITVVCHVLLQKPTDRNSAPSFAEHLQQRLLRWKLKQIESLMDEASCIQEHLPVRLRTRHGDEKQVLSERTFANLVFSGRTQSACRYISSNSSAGVLHMDDRPIPGSSKTVMDVLLEKHPDPKEPPKNCLMKGPPLGVNPILFARITPALIRDVSRRIQGSAGPSGLDAQGRLEENAYLL